MIEAAGVRVSFSKGFRKPKIHALDGFSLHVEQGEIFALLGPNGAGKSTAMYCFLGLLRPREGTVKVFGETPEPGHPLFQRMAYLPEEPQYHLYLTIQEAVAYYGALYRGGVPPARAREAIERVGLWEQRDLKLAKCSKGMKQKAGIAVCLLREVDLLLLDEPTRGLDPLMVRELRNLLVEMNRGGTTIVLNSHLLSEIEMICTRAAVMNRGRVVAQDSLKALMHYDTDHYAVDIEPAEDLPEFMTDVVRTFTSIKGVIPSSRVGEFFAFTAGHGLKVYGCAHHHQTLEEAFFAILKEAEG